MTGDILNSWKEVAGYVGRGVRTVQRWEVELGFPVRRPRGKNRSAVIALKPEIDLWLRTPHANGLEQELIVVDGPGLVTNSETLATRADPHKVKGNNLFTNAEALRARAAELIAHSSSLQEQISLVIKFGRVLRASCASGRGDRKTWATAHQSLRLRIHRAMELGAELKATSTRGGTKELDGSNNWRP